MFDVDKLLEKNKSVNNNQNNSSYDFSLDKLADIYGDLKRWKEMFFSHLENKQLSSKTIRSYLFTINNFIIYLEKFPPKEFNLLSDLNHIYINDYLDYIEFFSINSKYGTQRERLIILTKYLNSLDEKKDELENRHFFIEERLEFSVESIDYTLDLWEEFCKDKKSNKIEDSLLIEFIEYMNKSDLEYKSSVKTMQLRKSTIQSFFTFMSEFNVQKVDFKELYPLIKNYKLEKNSHIHQVRGLQDKDEELLIAFLNKSIEQSPHNYKLIKNILLIQLMFYSGLRVSEAVNLKYEDISKEIIDNKTIYIMSFIGKGNKRRIVPIKSTHIEDTFLLVNSKKIGKYISSKTNGEKMSEEGIKVFFRKIQKEANFKGTYSIHQLRHSFAENFVVKNGNIRILQEILGHADIKTSMIYGQVKKNDLLKNAV